MTANHMLTVFSLALAVSHLPGNVGSGSPRVMNITTTLFPCRESLLQLCGNTLENPMILSLYGKPFQLPPNCHEACYCQSAAMSELNRNNAEFIRHPNPNCILEKNCNFPCPYHPSCGHIIVITYTCSRNQQMAGRGDASLNKASEMDGIGTDVYILIALFGVFTLLVLAITVSLVYFHKKRKSLVELTSEHRERARNIYTSSGALGISRRASAPNASRDNTEWMSIGEVETLRLSMNLASVLPRLSEEGHSNTTLERQSGRQAGPGPPMAATTSPQGNHAQASVCATTGTPKSVNTQDIPEYVNTQKTPKSASTQETPEYINTQKTPEFGMNNKNVNNQTTSDNNKTPITTQGINTQENPNNLNFQEQECKPMEEATHINEEPPSYENFPTNVGTMKKCQDDDIDEVDGTVKSTTPSQPDDDYCSDDSDDIFETVPSDHVRRYLRNLPKDNIPYNEEPRTAAGGLSVHMQRFLEQCATGK